MPHGWVDQEPIRIAYVLKKYPRLSETFILNEILGLEKAGQDVSVFSLRLPDEGRFHSEVSRFGGTVDYLPEFKSASAYEGFRVLSRIRDPNRLSQAIRFLDLLPQPKRPSVLVQALHLAEFVRQRKVDHLHAHFMTIASHTAYMAHLFTGVSFSVTAHAKDIFRDTVNEQVFRTVAEAAFRIVTVTDFNRRFIAERFLKGDSTKVVRLYNGIPLDEFRELQADAGRRDPKLVMGVGRLVEKKGFRILLEACRILNDRGHPVRCRIIGQGEELAALQAERARMGLDGTVTFTGSLTRDEVLHTMRQARVLAAPCITGTDGNRDALPTVLLESLAMRLPVVSTRVNGIPEIVDDGKEGFLVPERNATALANAIHKLVTDDAVWGTMSEAGPGKVAAKFDREKTLPGLLGIFREASGRHARMMEASNEDLLHLG